MNKNYKKIKYPETNQTYQKEAIELAFGYCPKIEPCPRCGHPVISGYICITCNYGSINEQDL